MSNLRNLIPPVLLAVCLSVPVHADPVAYSDDYISFEYDDDVFQNIEVYTSGSIALYGIDPFAGRNGGYLDSHIVVRLDANAEPDYLETIFIPYTDVVTVEDLSDTEKVFHYEAGNIQFHKLLWSGKDQYILASMFSDGTIDDDYNYIRDVYDSIQISDMFDDEIGYTIEKNEVVIDIEDQTIFQNAVKAN